jgi:hydroxyethylthiazole kinase-like uncharacterized protein yjeF
MGNSTDIERIGSAPRLPARSAEGHKGLFGRVLVVGGNEEMIGAPVLAGTAALRMGAGLVQIAVAREVLAASISITPELIGLGLDDGVKSDRRLVEAAQKADAVVVGPGLGQGPAAQRRVGKLIGLDVPMVIDADGLNILASGKRWPKGFKARAVLTPHPGEMKRLMPLIGGRWGAREQVPAEDEGRIELAAEAARAFGQVMVLKGGRTVVTDGQRVYLNRTGDSSLSKAGTGDVLSGMIGCLLGQGMEGFGAACVSVHLHGLAGELAGKAHGRRSVLAWNVIDAIPEALREYEQL